MNKDIFSIDEKLYIKAKAFCRKLSPDQRGDFFYTLLDWCDQRQDIQESLAKKYDAYEVAYLLNGTFGKEQFDYSSGTNPYSAARLRYSNLLSEGADCIELRKLPNPYLEGTYRYGKLILSYDSEVK